MSEESTRRNKPDNNSMHMFGTLKKAPRGAGYDSSICRVWCAQETAEDENKGAAPATATATATAAEDDAAKRQAPVVKNEDDDWFQDRLVEESGILGSEQVFLEEVQYE